ncbi:MAG: hypothetical protein Dbin4_03059 [Alphaproteobacteria bacterium]|nr:hypothetical protein [Alphaproteobacteria bacterium]
MLDRSRLKALLHYDPDTGAFTWRVKPNRRIRVGDVAGDLRPNGYRRIRIDGKPYAAHRLAWLYVYDRWPANQLDHMNGVRDDNRWDNLREATNAENSQNRNINSNSTSGLMGVCWHKQRQKLRAEIQIAGRKKHLGLFTTPEDAHAAYLAAKADLHTFQPVPRCASGATNERQRQYG